MTKSVLQDLIDDVLSETESAIRRVLENQGHGTIVIEMERGRTDQKFTVQDTNSTRYAIPLQEVS